MKVQMLKKARTLLLFVVLLAGMIYSALAVTTRSAYAACDCSQFTQEIVDFICQGPPCLADHGDLQQCDPNGFVILCRGDCFVGGSCP